MKSFIITSIAFLSFHSNLQFKSVFPSTFKEEYVSIIETEPEILSIYKVTKQTLNGSDLSEHSLEVDQAVLFFTNGDNFYFMNTFRNEGTYSSGEIFGLKTDKQSATTTNYANDLLTFTWSYFNSYDSKSGTAKVSFLKIYIGDVVKFVCTITVLDTNDVIELQGFLE